MNRKIVPMVLGALLLALALTSPGRRFLDSVTRLLGASAVSSSERYEISIRLEYDGDRTYTWKGHVTRREYGDAESIGTKAVERYIDEAKRALAVKLGYVEDVYGEDASKLQCCKISRIALTDTRSGRTIYVHSH